MTAGHKRKTKPQGSANANSLEQYSEFTSTDGVQVEDSGGGPPPNEPIDPQIINPQIRLARMTPKQQALVDAEDHGFKSVSMPYSPTALPGYVTKTDAEKEPPGALLPTDEATVTQLMNMMKINIRVLRDLLVLGVNETSSTNINRLKKPTCDEPSAQFFASVERPLPISFYAQDRLRHILSYMIIIEDEERALASIPENSELGAHKKFRKAHQINKNNEQACWNELKQQLADQLPGEDENNRRQRAQDIMDETLKVTCFYNTKKRASSDGNQGHGSVEAETDGQADIQGTATD